MRQLKPDFSPVEVAFKTRQISVDAVHSYIVCLVAGGFVELVHKRVQREVHRYRLVKDTGLDTPRLNAAGKPVTQGTGRDRMWHAIRLLREFDYRELAAAASDECHAVSPAEAQTYVKFLCRANYVRLGAHAVRGANACPARYRFIPAMNTGPRAPMVTRKKEVLDTNTGQVVWPVRRAATDEEVARYDHE